MIVKVGSVMKKGELLIYIASILIGIVMFAVDAEDTDKVVFLGLMLFSGNIATCFSPFFIKMKTMYSSDSKDVAYEQNERWRLGRLFNSHEKSVSLTSSVIAVNTNALIETIITDLTHPKKC
ncbi:MAG: hypothetical protein IKE52_01355 [Mogibacterium sp.]|nr:hypothetical protein [Mogibacterium sp.]